jgi:hypothetical protein
MKKMNSYFEQTSKQKSVLLQNCSVMAQLARALAARQGIELVDEEPVDPMDEEPRKPTRKVTNEHELQAWRQIEREVLGWEPCNDIVDLHFLEVLLRKKCPRLVQEDPDFMDRTPVEIFNLYLEFTDSIYVGNLGPQ